MEKLLSQVQEKYDAVCSQLKTCRRQLEEFNAQDEVRKAHECAESVRKHSLLVMTDKELIANKRFRSRHYDSCHSTTFQYELAGTGIGTVIKVRCPVCQAEEDITDLESW